MSAERPFFPMCRCQDKAEQARVTQYINALARAAGPAAEAAAHKEAWPDG